MFGTLGNQPAVVIAFVPQGRRERGRPGGSFRGGMATGRSTTIVEKYVHANDWTVLGYAVLRSLHAKPLTTPMSKFARYCKYTWAVCTLLFLIFTLYDVLYANALFTEHVEPLLDDARREGSTPSLGFGAQCIKYVAWEATNIRVFVALVSACVVITHAASHMIQFQRFSWFTMLGLFVALIELAVISSLG